MFTLLSEIDGTGVNCYIVSIFLNVLAHADDSVLCK